MRLSNLDHLNRLAARKQELENVLKELSDLHVIPPTTVKNPHTVAMNVENNNGYTRVRVSKEASQRITRIMIAQTEEQLSEVYAELLKLGVEVDGDDGRLKTK